MKTLFLARHAHSISNRDGLAWSSVPGDGLTPEGVEQARRLGAALADEEIELGVATDLLRAQETLELALDGRQVPTLVVSELNEIDFGDFNGGPLDAYRAWAAVHPPTAKAPGHGESRADAAARYATGVRRALGRPEESVLLVAHALCVRYILDAAEGVVPAPLMAPIGNADFFRLSAPDALAAAELLETWSRAPRFRRLELASE